MVRGLYTAASGMMVQMIRTDTIANNLANVRTSGFKRELSMFRAIPTQNIIRINDKETTGPPPATAFDPRPFIGTMGTGVRFEENFTDFQQGTLETTGNPTDLALQGDGFFVLQTPRGLRYTRDGHFRLGSDRSLVSSEGYPVLGLNGPIVLGEGQLAVTTDGQLTQDGQPIATLRIAGFPDKKSLRKEGHNLFVAGAPEQAAAPAVHQGAVEGANVDMIHSMVSLIEAFRAYEINQRVVTAEDEMTGRAVNDVGRNR
ncbi:MAG: flagellar basal-body rod protein FlgF [Armatimonadetes bacterium]|nr:flagellar basal-body rod protein FlgF [Armatimonadota bacterium]